MTLDRLVALGRDLASLAVFRALLDDPVVDGLRRHLDAAARGGDVDAYAGAVAALYASGKGSLARYVRDAVLEDENPYLLRRGAGEEVPPSMEASVTRELAVLGRLAELAPDDFACSGDLLDADRIPGYELERVDLEADYAARIAEVGVRGYGIYARHHVFDVDGEGRIRPVRYPDPIRLSDLVDYERERAQILENTEALLKGLPAANILLTGDAGTGKSSTVKAVANELADRGLRILEVRKEQLHEIPGILDALTRNPLKFVIFIDDLSFSANDDDFAALKAILEGSVSSKSDNVAIYATSNRRHLVRERFSDREGDDIHRNDTMQEIISLSDRFGLRISFSRPDKETYLRIVRKLAADAGVAVAGEELDLLAERFATRRGSRSARGARQFVDSLVAKGE